MYRDSGGWIGLCCLNASPAGAGTPSDDSLCTFSRFFEILKESLSSHHTVHTVLTQRWISLNSKNVISPVLFYDLLPVLFKGFSRCSGERIIVLKRYHGKHHIRSKGGSGPYKRFGAASTLKPVYPKNRYPWLCFQSSHHLRYHGWRKTHYACYSSCKL